MDALFVVVDNEADDLELSRVPGLELFHASSRILGSPNLDGDSIGNGIGEHHAAFAGAAALWMTMPPSQRMRIHSDNVNPDWLAVTAQRRLVVSSILRMIWLDLRLRTFT